MSSFLSVDEDRWNFSDAGLGNLSIKDKKKKKL